MPLTRSAGFASALPIVAAMDAAMIFSGRPSRDSAPFDASCILESENQSTFVSLLGEAGGVGRRTCP